MCWKLGISKNLHVKSILWYFCGRYEKKWNGLNYVEICSGPGRCVTRDLDEAEEFDGTALSIIRHDSFKFIKSAIFIDANEDVVSILNTRIAAMNKTNIAKAVIGNYIDNGDMKSIVSKLPPNYLNLVFIDPTDCSVPFSTIKTIKENLKNVDFIINFAVGTDLTRNIIPSIYKPNYQKVKEKYARFLGTEDFFDREDVKNYCVDPKRAKNIFLDEYKKNLLNIGFRFIESHPVEHYYYLLYVTGHPVGLKFWKEVCKIEYDGQRTLF